MPKRAQLAKIHILKKQAGLNEDQYRLLLASFGAPLRPDGEPTSSRFTDREANKFIHFLQDYMKRNNLLNEPARSSKKKYDELSNRPGDFATPRQLRMIEAIWREVARDPSDDALETLIANKTGVPKLIWLKKEQVRKVLVILNTMKKKQHV